MNSTYGYIFLLIGIAILIVAISFWLAKSQNNNGIRFSKILNKDNSFEPFIKNINVEKFISRQDLPTLFCTSGSVYARSYNLLSKFTGKDFCLGEKPCGVLVSDIESINIDRKIDFEFAQFIMKNKKKYE